jgi:transposase
VNEITTIGLDLAKNVFHYVGRDRGGGEISKKQLKRKAVLSHVANLASCLIGIEACAGAHQWG